MSLLDDRGLSSKYKLSSSSLVIWASIWSCVALVSSLLFYWLPPSPDHVVYDYIGWSLNKGNTLYVDVADQNWPGQMFIHMLSNALFGHGLHSYRLFEICFIIPASCFILFNYLRTLGLHTAACVVVPVYVLMYTTTGNWNAGQRDMVAAPLLVLAAQCLSQRAIRGGPFFLLMIEALCLSCAGLIRPTLLIMAPLLALVDLLMSRANGRSIWWVIRDHSLVALAMVTMLASLAAAGMPQGITEKWFEVAILFNLEIYSASASTAESLGVLSQIFADSWLWYIVWSAAGAYLLAKRLPKDLLFLSMMLPAALVSFFVQGKALGYHLFVLLPLMALLISCAIAAAVKEMTRQDKRPYLIVLALMAVCLPPIGFAKKLHKQLNPQIQFVLGLSDKERMYQHYSAGEFMLNEVIEIAEFINSNTAADSHILFWGRSCHLYTLSDRMSAVFPISSAIFFETNEDFSHFDEWQQQMENEMAENQPQMIILAKNKQGPGYIGLPPQKASEALLSDLIHAQLPSYQLIRSFPSADIYQLQTEQLADQSSDVAN